MWSGSDIFSTIFEGISENYTNEDWLTSRVILSNKNSRLIELNNCIGDMILGQYRTYLSADKVENEDRNALTYPVELINTLIAGYSLPDHSIKLNKGFIVMLFKELAA